ncbi:MAG: tRNA (guanosine(46)-N7)-methyltransferase TrmB [Hyphomicrobiaceae bacterium]
MADEGEDDIARAGWEARDLRSFGRRRARKATDRQRELRRTLLPQFAASLELLAEKDGDPAQLFAHVPREVWLEIGFGGGEHLVWQAADNPHVGLIGAEPFEDGVVKTLDVLSANGVANVRILADDVRPLLRAMRPASLARVFILFPDPWPKRRHAKRRLVQGPLVDLLAHAMRPGAEVRIATDIGDYLRTALAALLTDDRFFWTAGGPADWRVRPADWPETRYEQRALREGRRCYYLRFVRTGTGPED